VGLGHTKWTHGQLWDVRVHGRFALTGVVRGAGARVLAAAGRRLLVATRRRPDPPPQTEVEPGDELAQVLPRSNASQQHVRDYLRATDVRP